MPIGVDSGGALTSSRRRRSSSERTSSVALRLSESCSSVRAPIMIEATQAGPAAKRALPAPRTRRAPPRSLRVRQRCHRACPGRTQVARPSPPGADPPGRPDHVGTSRRAGRRRAGPHQNGALLVYGEGYKLVLSLSGLQSVVDLLAYVALQSSLSETPKAFMSCHPE